MKYILTLFCFISAFSSAVGQCPAWDSLGLGVSHSDNIGLLGLVCPGLFKYDEEILLRSADNLSTINLLYSLKKESIVGFEIKNELGKTTTELHLEREIIHDPEYEFSLIVLLAHSSTDFSKFKFVLSVNDQIFSIYISSEEESIQVIKVFGNGGSLLRISSITRNRMDYLHDFTQLEINRTENVLDSTIPIQTLQVISVKNDTVKFKLNPHNRVQSVIFISKHRFFLKGANLLWLCELSTDKIVILNKIINDIVVFQNPISTDSTRGVYFILDSLGIPVGFLHAVKDSLQIYRHDTLVHTIVNKPDFLRFRGYAYLVDGVLYFYTQEEVHSYIFFGKRIVSRMRSHAVPISKNEKIELRSNYADLSQSTIDGEWIIGNIRNQLFYNDYQKGDQDFRIWSPKL